MLDIQGNTFDAGMSDFRDIEEIRASTQLSEIRLSSLSLNSQFAPVSGLDVETLSSILESDL